MKFMIFCSNYDTNGKVTNSQLDTTDKSQEVSPFQKVTTRHTSTDAHKCIANTRQKKTCKIHKRSTALEWSVKYFTGGFKPVSRLQPYPKYRC